MAADGSWAGRYMYCYVQAAGSVTDSHSAATHAPLMEDVARRCQAAVVFPCYTRAPEKQFPFQFEQTYGVLDHIVRNCQAYCLDVEAFALAGDSAGGEFTGDQPRRSTRTDNLQDTWPSPWCKWPWNATCQRESPN